MEKEYHHHYHYHPEATAGAGETGQSSPKKKKKKRFGDEQIRLLESIFESETKLEPRRKLQLARELGLQPRQIDIWFQNRRARWKSKQIEQDYKTLKADYDNLASKFESLKKEKQSLILQMEKLSELVAEPDHEMQDKASNGGLDGSSSTGVGGSDYGEFKCNQLEAEANTSFQQAAGFEEWGFLGLQIGEDDDRDSEQADAGHKAGEEFLSIDEYRPPSPHKLYGFDSAHMTNSQGFNFWI